MAANLGAAVPLAYFVCAVATALVALCIAEAGYKDLDAEELVRLRDHGVNPFRLSGGGLEYDPDEIKQARLGFKSGEQRPADAFAPHFLCDVRALELSDLRP